MNMRCFIITLISLLQAVTSTFHSCQDVYYANPQSKSGTYRIYNKKQQVYDVWCEFHKTYGYAFVSNLSHVEINIDDLYTDKSHVILRHLTTSGIQKEVKVEQLSQYHTRPLTFYYNKHDSFAEPMNHAQLGPYLYLGFLPRNIANRRSHQGYRAGGHDCGFNNCDANPNSYLALYFNNKHANPVGYYRRCCRSSLVTAWARYSTTMPKEIYMEPHYYFIFEMHFGGCGGYEISLQQDFTRVTGVAIGFRFDIKDLCSSSPCLNGATCVAEGLSYYCECKEGYEGENCQIAADT